MLLALDIGNSSISLGVFPLDAGEKTPAPLLTAKLSADTGRTADEYAVIMRSLLAEGGCSAAVTAAVIGSVVPQLTHTLESAVGKLRRDAPIPVTHRRGWPHSRYRRPRRKCSVCGCGLRSTRYVPAG